MAVDQDATSSSQSSFKKADPEKGSTQPVPSDPDQSHGYGPEPPNGGLTAWLVVLGAWCTSFCSFGWLNSVGAFQEYYQNELLKGYSQSAVSWIPSLQIFFMMAVGPIVGHIFDRHGPRMLLLVGSFMHVFGIMMASLGTEYYQILLVQGVLSAIGVSAIFQAGLNCIHSWFSTKRGAAFGILSTGSSLGGVIFPIMTTHLIREVGFPWAMRTCAFIMLFLLTIANLVIKNNAPPSPHSLSWAQIKRPFREASFIFLLLGFFCFTYGLFVPINYLPTQAIEAGMGLDLAQYLIPILNGASLFGRMFSGIVGDKIGRYNIFIVVCYLSGIWVLALWIPSSSTAGLITFAALFGFTSGAYVSLIAPLVMQISPLQEIGFRSGIIFLTNSIGGLTTSPISGAIVHSSGGWTGAKIFAGVFCIAGTTFVVIARIIKVGWSPKAVF